MNCRLKIKVLLAALIVLGVILPNFSFAEEAKIEVPENLEEVKELGGKAVEIGKKELPETMEKAWQEEVLPLWQRMYDWFKRSVWEPYFAPFFQKEIEKRKPEIKEEFEKEKQEMKEPAKEEIPKATKSLWEKLKELFK